MGELRFSASTHSLTTGHVCVFHVTADDCFQLGKVAYDNEDYYHAIKWFDQALLIDDIELNKTTSRCVILDYLSFSVFKVRALLRFLFNLMHHMTSHMTPHSGFYLYTLSLIHI